MPCENRLRPLTKNPSGEIELFRFSKVVFYLLILPHLLVPVASPLWSKEHPAEHELEDLVDDLQGDPEEAGAAIKRLVELEEYDLIRRETPELFARNDPELTGELLFTFQHLGMSLETYFPEWYKFILQKVNVRSPQEQIHLAVQLAGFWKEHRLMPLLSRFAVHPSHEVRMDTFRAMSTIRNDTLIPVLLRLLTSDRAIERIYGLEGAVSFTDNRTLPFALKLLDDPVRSVRVFAVLRLGAQENSDSISHLIVRNYRSDDDPEVREAVIEMIRKERWTRHAYLLHRAVLDPAPIVRKAALLGVRELNEVRAAGNISRALVSEDVPGIKKLGLDVLVALGNSGGGEGIETLLRNDYDEEIRLSAAVAAGILGDRGFSFSLAKSLRDDPSGQVRLEAAYALGRIGSISAADDLYASVSDESELYEIRAASLVSYRMIRGKYPELPESPSMQNESLQAIARYQSGGD